jgi:protein-disulfide isomerase
MKSLFVVFAVLATTACVSRDQMADTLKKNPEILATAIKENPTMFMDAIREAAKADQQAQIQNAMKERQTQREKDFKNPRDVKVDPSRIVYGDANAPITIVKYADFQCPACRMGFESLEEIKKKYPGKIRFVHKNIPLEFHKQARTAALIYEGLVMTDKKKALEFYKAAYSQQPQWSGSKEKLLGLAKKLGVSKEILAGQVKDGEITKRLNEDMAEFEKLGFDSTPSYVVNGVTMVGAQSPEDLSAVIDRTLKKN